MAKPSLNKNGGRGRRKAGRKSGPPPVRDVAEHGRIWQALLESEDRYRATFDYAPVGIMHTGVDDNRILFVNPRLAEMLGYTPNELLAMTSDSVVHPDHSEANRERYRSQMLAGDLDSFASERKYVRKDGAVIWVKRTVSLVRDPLGRPLHFVRIVEDITQRKLVESNLDRLARARHVMAECRRVLVRAAEEPAMLQEMCAVVVASGGYKMAWIGLATGEEARPVHLAAHSGYDGDAPMTALGAWSADGRYQGFMHEVITNGVPHIARDILKDPKFAHRRPRAIQHGFQSSIALPLKGEGRIIGGMAIYAREPDAFDSDEISLLTEVADDIAFGLTSLRARVERELSERRVREVERRALETFDQAAVGITRTDQSGVTVEANQKFCDMLGYSREEILGCHIREFTHPEDHGQGARFREALVRGEVTGALTSEKRFLRKDGSVIWARRTLSAARDEDGEIRYVVAVVEDITGRKEVEERYRSTFDNAPIGIMYTSVEDDRLLQVNPKLCEMLGYEPGELTGMLTNDLIPAALRGMERGQYRTRMLNGELKSFSSERLLLRKNGSVIGVNRTISLARDSSGNPLYFIRVIEDITSRRELERRFRDTFEQAAVGIFHVALDGRCLRVNRKFSEITGYSEEEMTGEVVPVLSHPGDEESGGLNRARLLSGQITSHSNEKRYIRKDGTEIWVNRTESLARDESGKPLYLIRVIEDITGRKELESRFRDTFEQAAVGIIHAGLDGRYLRVNRKLCEITGYNEEELTGPNASRLSHPDDVESGGHNRQRLLSGEILSHNNEKRYLRKDGTTIWVNRTESLARDESGRPLYLIRVIEDITGRKVVEETLRESEEQFRQLAGNIPQAFWITDIGQRETLYVSPAAEAMLGKPMSDILADRRTLIRAVHKEDRARVYAARKAAVAGGYDETYRILRPDGSIRWVHDRAFPVRDAGGAICRIAGIAEDVTDRKHAEERLEHLAHYDVLTGLPNRVLFYDRLKQALVQARRNKWTTGVMFIDADRFKNVNDTLGHSVGDKLLQQFAGRLTRSVRADDTVGRLGGDEFAIVLSSLASGQDANLVAQKIIAAFNEPFKLDGVEVYLTGSIGITLYPDDSTDQDTLIRNADAAMYRAKETGRNGYQFYTPEMNARAMEMLGMENSLRRALERNEFLLHYQPKASVAQGGITGVEALLRWKHPERGLVPPGDFIPFLEDSGLIVKAGEWVLRTVCAQIKAWESAGIRPVPVAVNLSARQFSAKNLDASIKRTLEQYRVDPALIEFEITESSLMANTEESVRTLEYFDGLGVSLSVDDFGTGYSSLSYLKRFPLSALKIDRSFVRDVTGDPDDATITRAVISMAHSLGLRVIAEGVETRAQLEFLAEHGCDEVQGYYFARPMVAEECGAWIRERRRLIGPGSESDAGVPSARVSRPVKG